MKNKYKICISIIFLSLSISATGQTIPSYIPLNGLVAWWPFNGNAIDESGNINDGTVNGPTLIADRYSNSSSAYLWNNSSDKIIVVSNPQTQLTASFTISAWINPINSTYGTGPNYHAIIEKWGSTGDASYLIGLRPTGVPFVNTHDGSLTTGLDALQSVPQNTWTNIVYTQNADTGNIFINGVLDTSRTGMVIPLVMNNDLIFGSNDSYNSGWAGDAFEGIIDDIGMWNRPLTENEVLSLYQSANSTALLENSILNQLIIFQSPVNDKLTFTFNSVNSSATIIALYNLSGQEVSKEIFQFSTAGYKEITIPISGMKNGIYTLQLIQGALQISKQFVIAD